MKVKLEDIEQALDFVNFGPYGDHSALLDKASGKIFWHSESGDIDEIPEDMWESEDAIEIPHKNDLGPGNQLVFDFVRSHIPDDYGHVRDIFSRRGAYARYKEFRRKGDFKYQNSVTNCMFGSTYASCLE
jgi:hypothetical protein